jgi:hypothetical protein
LPFSDPTTTLPASEITGPIVRDTPNGGKIVLDDDGAIKTYNPDGNVTNYLGGDFGVMWNQFGWPSDPLAPSPEWVGMNGGNLQLATGTFDEWQAQADTTGPFDNPGALGVLAVGWALDLTSPTKGVTPYNRSADMRIMSGKQTYQSGTVDAPAVHFLGTDLGVTNPIVHLSGPFDNDSWRTTPETWQSPTYNTGWAGASTSGTYQALQFRHGIEDDVTLVGVFHATAAGPGSQIFTLPAAYCPKVNQRIPLDSFVAAGSSSSANASMIVNTSGVVQVFCSAAVAASQNFAVNARFPLGNMA